MIGCTLCGDDVTSYVRSSATGRRFVILLLYPGRFGHSVTCQSKVLAPSRVLLFSLPSRTDFPRLRERVRACILSDLSPDVRVRISLSINVLIPRRLEVEPSGLLNGRSLWWFKRIRYGLLAAALDDAASGRPKRFLSAAVEEWLEGATKDGPC